MKGRTHTEGVQEQVLREYLDLRMRQLTGEWRKLCKKEFWNLYSSPSIMRDQIKEDAMGGTHSTHGEDKRYMKF